MRTKLTVLLVCMSALGCLVAHADPILELYPAGSMVSSGDISTQPGDITGWGITLAEPDTDYDVITGSYFCLGTSNGITNSCILPDLGTYKDSLGPQFIVMGPLETTSLYEDFDNNSMMGAGSFTSNGVVGTDMGQIVVTYDIYAQDPNLVQPQDPIEPGQFVTA